MSVRRAGAVFVASVACWLLAATPAAALLRPASGTLDLQGLASYDEEFPTPPGSRGARAYIGDVNGGLEDIAIGVPTADPQGRTNAGSVYVLFGGGEPGRGSFGSIDLTSLGTRGYRIDGAKRGDRLGTSIEALGYDIGEDGLRDFAIGAPNATDGGPARAGVVYLVPGSSGERRNIDLGRDDDTSIIRINGAAAGDRAGKSLSAPRGTRRLIVGAPGADPGGRADAGSAFVLTDVPPAVAEPRRISLATARGFRLDGRVAGGAAGAAVGWSLDFDGDGRTEVLVGAPGVSPDASGTAAGEAYIVPSGTAGAVTLGSPAGGGIVAPGEPGMGLGTSVAGMGDMSGDGLADVAIGAPTASPGGRAKAGSAVVVTSRRLALLPMPGTARAGRVLRIDGVARGDRFGSVVAAANLDGGTSADDLLVSAPLASALGRRRAGAIYALPGRELLGGIDVAQLGDAAVRIAGPRANERSGTDMSVGGPERSLAIFGGVTSTALLRLAPPAPAPPPAASGQSRIPGCVTRRDVELVIDGSRSMAPAVPYLRTGIDALLSKPRGEPVNVGAIEIGRRTKQVFPPLTVPTTGVADARELRTLRALLDENIDAAVGKPDFAAGLAAAVAARRQASALVLFTDARQPPPATPLPSLGKLGTRIYVLQIGGGPKTGSGAILRDLAIDSGGGYFPDQDAATLPSTWAIVEAGLTCETALTTQVLRNATIRRKTVGTTSAAAKVVSTTTLTPQRPEATFRTGLGEAQTATLTFSFKQRRRAPRAGCVRGSPLSLQGVRIYAGAVEIARSSARDLARALNGRPVTFGRVLRLSGRCGRGFLVVEVSGLERLPGAQAQAAASSPIRSVGIPAKLRKPPTKRAIKAVGIGSLVGKGHGR